MATEDHDYPISWDWQNYYREQEGENVSIPERRWSLRSVSPKSIRRPKRSRQRRLHE